jgi:hypothetical protein
MASVRALAWIDRLIWILIYGGLLMVVLGVATGGAHLIAGWSLGVVGGIAAAAGFILIGVRSRLRETPTTDAQPTSGKAS